MQQLRRLSLAGLALLLGAPLHAAAQDDSGTLEVLVEDPSGPRSPDGTPSLTFETRTVLNLEKVDIGPGRPVTDSGQRIGTGSGTVITPTVTVSELVTEASVYPQKFRQMTKDAQGRIWATAREPGGLFVFSESTNSWRRVIWSRFVENLGRDGQGRIWVTTQASDSVIRISGNTMTEYSGLEDLGVGWLISFGGGAGDAVWMGGYSVNLGGSNPALFLRFDGREWRLFSHADGLPSYSWIDAMAVDSTGTVWGMPIYDSPDHIDRADSFVAYSLFSYDGREWRGYQAPLGKPIGWYSVGMLVDPGGTLWISTPYLLAHQTASGWMEYEYSSFYGFGKPAMAAERAGRIWIDGGGWIGVFESGQLHRTPSGSNPDIFVGPVNQARKLYYDGEWLWIANQSLARWRLSQRATSVEDEPGPESSGKSRLMDSYPNPFNARTIIGFELDRRQPVSLRVHNLTGQRVTTLAEGVYPEGVFAVSWDGRDDQGREVASGVYLCRLRLAEQALSHPLTLVR